MSATLAGLLGGITAAAEENRKYYRQREDEQADFERKELSRIAGDEAYTPDVRERAATLLMEVAANPGARKRGSFTERLMGVERVQAHPAMGELLKFFRTPVEKSLPMWLVDTQRSAAAAPASAPPNPPAPEAAPPPASAAMPTTPPMGQAGGGPPSVANLGSPAGPVAQAPQTEPSNAQNGPAAAGSAPPALGVSGRLPVDESTGAGPQGRTAPVLAPPRILRSPAEVAIETARARARGDIEGEIEGLATFMPRDQAVEIIKAEKLRAARGLAGQTYAEGNIYQKPNGTWVQTLYRRDNPSITMEIPAVAPSLRSVAAPTEEAQLAAELFGGRYPQFATDPNGLLRAISPAERAVLAQTQMRRTASQQGMNTSARMFAEANGPLSTSERGGREDRLRAELARHDEAYQTMLSQYGIMRTALNRFQQDPVGAVEGIRVTFAKILDPTSVVREAEYARQGFGLSAFDKLRGMYQQYVEGGGNIPEPILREMVETARQFVQGARERSVRIQQHYRNIAIREQLNPDNIIITLGQGGPPAASPGTITAPAPTATAPAGVQGQGGPPALPAAPTAAAPARGAFVGNEVPAGARRGTHTSGRPVADIPGVGVVFITQGPDGKWYWTY